MSSCRKSDGYLVDRKKQYGSSPWHRKLITILSHTIASFINHATINMYLTVQYQLLTHMYDIRTDTVLLTDE